MSFLSDLFSGNFGNLGNDLAPSNIFSDTTKDIGGSNTLLDLGLLGGAIAAPFALSGLGGALGIGAAGDAAAAATAATPAAADLGAASAAAPLGFAGDVGAGATDLSSFLAAPTGTAGTGIGTAGASGFDLGTIGPGAGAAGGASPLSLAPSLDTATALTPAASPAAAQAAAGGAGSFLSNLGAGNLGDALSAGAADIKTAAPYLGIGGLGYNLYSGYETNQANKALTSQEQTLAASAAATAAANNANAQPLINSGETLMTYLQTGTLPQAFQAQVQQQVAAAKAGIIQGYAARGMSTNPQQNSQLQQDLSNVDLQAQSLQANLESTLSTAGNQMVTTANQLLSTGLSATQLAAEIPVQVATLNANLNSQMASAISSFAAALNGNIGVKPGSININLASANNPAINPSGTLNTGLFGGTS